MKTKVASIASGKKQKQNRKQLKKIDKLLTRLEKHTTKILNITQKMHLLRDSVQKLNQEKAA